MTDLNELKKLALASTPVGEVVRYEHGGGRMFNGTDLIADTFEEADREFYAVARQECLYLIARLERAEKALEQAVDAGSLAVVTVVKDAGYGMWRYEGVECIVGQSATENFFAGHPEDSPELAAWLKERR